MKARLPISSKHKKRIRQEVDNYYQQAGNDMTRRVFKLFCLALNEEFGFGKKRLSRLIAKVSEWSLKSAEDEVFWSHLDRLLIDRMGIDFERENYEVMDK